MSASSSTSATPASSKVFSILGKNLKANTPSELEPYLSELRELDDVEEVHFGGNSLGVEACRAIAEVLGSKKYLKVVDLADIFTGRLISEIPQALSALCDALAPSTTLVELDLSDNAFGGRCADAMVPFLTQNTSMEVFKLNNNGLGVWGGTVVSDALLANAAKRKEGGKKLRVIVCGRNRLENGSAPHWAKAFAAHGGLREVLMPQNGIRMEGIAALAEGLAACRELQVLDLQDNTATKVGTRSIVKHLSGWADLRVLNLSDCLVGSAGGVALATALAGGSNPKLQQLKLQYGEFDGKTVEILATAVTQHLSKLEVLELNGNRFSEDDECVEKLKEALEVHGNGEALDELDDMEEPESGDEDESEAEAEDSDEDEEGGEDDGVAPGEDGSKALPPTSDQAADALADLLAGVHVKPE